MKNVFKILFSISIIGLLGLSACTEKNDDPKPTTTDFGSVVVKLDHNFGGSAFTLNTPNFAYKTEDGDSVKFSMLKYYISNIKLIKADGTSWSENYSYHLADYSTAVGGVVTLTIDSVPVADYKSMTYTIGVDSLHNVSGAQTGDLAVDKNMFWSWTTGYIFMKAEGSVKSKAKAIPTADTTMLFKYHIGGFKESLNQNCVRVNTCSFGSDVLKVIKSGAPQIHLTYDVAKMFKGTVTVDVSGEPTRMSPGVKSVNISKNYAAGFMFEHLHN